MEVIEASLLKERIRIAPQVIEMGKVVPSMAIITAEPAISKANTSLMNCLVYSFMFSNICTEY